MKMGMSAKKPNILMLYVGKEKRSRKAVMREKPNPMYHFISFITKSWLFNAVFYNINSGAGFGNTQK